MITSKQRAQLRGMAAALNTELQIGKSGITENVVRQAEEALAARELIKGRVLDNSLLSAREACDALCEACSADGVQVIGSKFVQTERKRPQDRPNKRSQRKEVNILCVWIWRRDVQSAASRPY